MVDVAKTFSSGDQGPDDGDDGPPTKWRQSCQGPWNAMDADGEIPVCSANLRTGLCPVVNVFRPNNADDENQKYLSHEYCRE